MLNALVPVALYYGLRAVGASVYLALIDQVNYQRTGLRRRRGPSVRG